MLTLQTKKVSNMTKKGKHTVLFICLGNICRSPAAEGIMKTLVEKAGLQDEFEIDSAGIGGWHVGQLPDSRMRKCGAEHGYNFNSHARQFQKSDFARFETIVVMDNENYLLELFQEGCFTCACLAREEVVHLNPKVESMV